VPPVPAGPDSSQVSHFNLTDLPRVTLLCPAKSEISCCCQRDTKYSFIILRAGIKQKKMVAVVEVLNSFIWGKYINSDRWLKCVVRQLYQWRATFYQKLNWDEGMFCGR
jgi:hypothetical protein